MEKKIIFRSSSVGELLTEPKSKVDKEAGVLSETAKGLVERLWLKNEFGYEEDVMTDEMLKGILVEQESMALVQKVLKGEFRVAFKKNITNDYLSGTPDIVLKNESIVEDIKSCSNLRTFFEAEPPKLYVAQGQSYMELTKSKKFRLIYCLIKTPASIIASMKTKWFYKFGGDAENEDYIAASMQIDHNNNLIDAIPIEQRVKVFEYDYDSVMIAKIYSQIEKARVYYSTLKLKPYEPK